MRRSQWFLSQWFYVAINGVPKRDQYGPTMDEGIRMLGSAIKIDSNYSDAMAYMSLLYRLKAFTPLRDASK